MKLACVVLFATVGLSLSCKSSKIVRDKEKAVKETTEPIVEAPVAGEEAVAKAEDTRKPTSEVPSPVPPVAQNLTDQQQFEKRCNDTKFANEKAYFSAKYAAADCASIWTAIQTAKFVAIKSTSQAPIDLEFLLNLPALAYISLDQGVFSNFSVLSRIDKLNELKIGAPNLVTISGTFDISKTSILRFTFSALQSPERFTQIMNGIILSKRMESLTMDDPAFDSLGLKGMENLPISILSIRQPVGFSETRDGAVLEKIQALRRLDLTGAIRSCTFLGKLNNITSLSLSNMPLSSVQGCLPVGLKLFNASAALTVDGSTSNIDLTGMPAGLEHLEVDRYQVDGNQIMLAPNLKTLTIKSQRAKSFVVDPFKNHPTLTFFGIDALSGLNPLTCPVDGTNAAVASVCKKLMP